MFPSKYLHIHNISVSGFCICWKFNICQTIAERSRIRQFHEFFKSNFWRVFATRPKCALESPARQIALMLLARAAPRMALVRLRAGAYWCLWSWPRKWGELEAVLQCTAAEAVSSSRDHLVICSVEAASKQEASRSKAKRWCSYTEAVRGRLVGFRCRRSRCATNARGLWVSGARRGRMKVAKAHSEWRPELWAHSLQPQLSAPANMNW